MNRTLLAIIGIGFTVVSVLSYAYEQTTHEDLTETAALVSNLFSPENLESLGLEFEPEPKEIPKHKFPNTDNQERSILELLRDGANFEDYNVRAIFHFYDPVLEESSEVLQKAVYGSPAWALEDKGEYSFVEQNYSYLDAQKYLYAALTAENEEQRGNQFGRFFQTLGHISHHVQDMAQPEHVRADPHFTLSGLLSELQPVEGDPDFLVQVINKLGESLSKYEFFFEDHSRYENYTDEVRGNKYPGRSLPLTPTYLDFSNFPVGRYFWDNPDDTGLADFTNANFVSKDTNFELSGDAIATNTRYTKPFPDPSYSSYPESIHALYAEKQETVPAQIEEICPNGNGNFDECKVVFVVTTVTDNLNGASEPNFRASSLSLFDQDLQYFGPARYETKCFGVDCETVEINRLFALNKFNFDAAHQFLIPRAVAYSAGLINHFFRGKLEISRPGQYFYVDKDGITVDNTGATRLLARVQNQTAAIGGVQQHMGGGSLEAVVHYRLSGSDEWHYTRSDKKEQQWLPADALEPAEYVFTFADPIPLNASEVKLQIVYYGPMGEIDPETGTIVNEEDVVAAATIPIDLYTLALDPAPPSEGIYAVVDHAVTNLADDGFQTFKLQLSAEDNAVPPPFALSGGELRLYAHYYRDPCYQPDLSGEYKPVADGEPPTRWNGCTAQVEDTVYSTVSTAASLPLNEILSGPQTAAFNFDPPIPLNAVDLRLQLNYSFQAGVDAAEIEIPYNIGEASYFAVLNATDCCVAINGVFYTPEEVLASSALSAYVGTMNIDPKTMSILVFFGGTDVAYKSTLDPGTYIRIAVLTPPEQPIANASVWFYSSYLENFGPFNFPSVIREFEQSTDEIVPFKQRRGAYYWKSLIYYYQFTSYPPDYATMPPYSPENLAPKPVDVIF